MSDAGAHPDALRKRAKQAWATRDQWQKVLLDAYDFVAPYRMSTRYVTKAPANRVDRIFDNTAVQSLFRFAGKLQQELLPPGQAFFQLEAGPAIAITGMNKEEADRELETVTSQITPVFLNGEWDNAVHEMLIDLGISTGFMMILEGDAQQPVRFVTASMDEIAIDQGPYGDVAGIFWKRKWTYRAISEAWPKGRFDEAFRDALKSRPEEEIVLCQDTVFDAKASKWRLCVYLEKSDGDVWEDEFHECPWITPRYFKMPGQVYGFGPVLMVLPTIKTLNKAQELTLKAAAIAMSGIYTRVDDGVFNPDTARIEPGAMWAVARNGGVLGPSIQRLPPPGDLNMGNIVLTDLRMQVQAGLMDQQLPPDGQSPRSAAEIVARVKRLSADHAGAFGRLVHEIIQPVVRRVIEILHRQGVLKSRFKIDQLLVQLKVTSPLAEAFKAAKVEKTINWLQIVAQFGGPETLHGLTPLEATLAEIGADMGVPPHQIYTPDQRQQIQQTVKTLVAAAMAQQAQQNAPPPAPNGDPAQAA